MMPHSFVQVVALSPILGIFAEETCSFLGQCTEPCQALFAGSLKRKTNYSYIGTGVCLDNYGEWIFTWCTANLAAADCEKKCDEYSACVGYDVSWNKGDLVDSGIDDHGIDRCRILFPQDGMPTLENSSWVCDGRSLRRALSFPMIRSITSSNEFEGIGPRRCFAKERPNLCDQNDCIACGACEPQCLRTACERECCGNDARACGGSHPTLKREHFSRCYFACVDRTSSLGAIGIAIAMVLAILIGAASVFISWVLGFLGRAAWASGVGAALLFITLALLPASTEYPHLCAQVRFEYSVEMNSRCTFPIVLLGAGASFVGLGVSVNWLIALRVNNLGKIAAFYFVLVAIFNTCGVVGTLNTSCASNWTIGERLIGGWLAGSCLSNLLLLKLVLLRVNLVDASQLSCTLRTIYRVEVAAGVLFFIGTLWVSISGARIWLYVAMSFVVLFLLADVACSIYAVKVMRSVLHRTRQISESALSHHGDDRDSINRLGQSKHILWVANINVGLVAFSVATTSLFYIATILYALFLVDGDASKNKGWPAFFYMSWLFDSVANDACVIFVGFGSSDAALRTIGKASQIQPPSGQVLGAQSNVNPSQA